MSLCVLHSLQHAVIQLWHFTTLTPPTISDLSLQFYIVALQAANNESRAVWSHTRTSGQPHILIGWEIQSVEAWETDSILEPAAVLSSRTCSKNQRKSPSIHVPTPAAAAAETSSDDELELGTQHSVNIITSSSYISTPVGVTRSTSSTAVILLGDK